MRHSHSQKDMNVSYYLTDILVRLSTAIHLATFVPTIARPLLCVLERQAIVSSVERDYGHVTFENEYVWSNFSSAFVYVAKETDEDHLIPRALRFEIVGISAGGVEIHDSKIRLICRARSLGWLSLVNGTLSPSAYRELAGLGDLRHLILARTNVTSDNLKHLAKVTTLKHLDLDMTAIDDDGLLHLSGLSELEELSLCGTKITDNGLAIIANLPQLKKLYISRTQVGDNGMAAIASVRYLEELQIARTNVTDRGLRELQGLQLLSKLYAYQTDLTAEGVEQFRVTKPRCRLLYSPQKKVDALTGEGEFVPAPGFGIGGSFGQEVHRDHSAMAPQSTFAMSGRGCGPPGLSTSRCRRASGLRVRYILRRNRSALRG